MSDGVETNPVKKGLSVRAILLLLAVLSSPLGCCWLSFLPGIFQAEARVENRSGELLYITAITTTTGRPVVIGQRTLLRQRDIPIQPNQSIVLLYDAADMPLSGIAVCRANDDCRLLAVDHSNRYYVDSYESLPGLEPSWLAAIRSYPSYSFMPVLFPVLGLVPVVLFLSWLYLVLRSRFSRRLAGK